MNTIKQILAVVTILTFTACHKDVTTTPAAPAQPQPDKDLVITPAGLMEKSNVHFIPPGHFISMEKGRIRQIETKTGRIINDFGPVTRTPVTPAARPAAASGWIAYTYWSNPNTASPITNFTTTWTVPSVPSKQSSQTIFLFNGLQDGTTSTSYIIQPVLQWGPSAAGGGKYWAITNWYVSSSQAFFGTLVRVNAGTSLQGVMKQTAVSGSSYSYNSAFTGYSSASALQVNSVPQAFWAAETLESYGVTTPGTMYPPNTEVALTGIQILQGTTNAAIHWTTAQAVSGSAQRAVVVNGGSPNGEVDIYFR